MQKDKTTLNNLGLVLFVLQTTKLDGACNLL